MLKQVQHDEAARQFPTPKLPLFVKAALRPRSFIGFDDPPDDRVADDVVGGEATDVDAVDPVEPGDRTGGARGRRTGRIARLGVTAHTPAAGHAYAGTKPPHLGRVAGERL